MTETTERKLLSVRGIAKSYGAVKALRDVTLSVGYGECVALVGDNGAGKSTLVKTISGGVAPDSGTIAFDGNEVTFENPRHARDIGIETVYQDLALADQLTAVQNIFLGREWGWGVGALRIPKRRAMKQHVQELVARTGVNLPSLDSKVEQMSGGQRQGLAIARAVAWDAKLVVLDEPTAALGVRETAHVEEIVRGLTRQGVAVLIISHDLEQVYRLASVAFVLRHGAVAGRRVLASTPSDELVGLITGTVAADKDAAGV